MAGVKAMPTHVDSAALQQVLAGLTEDEWGALTAIYLAGEAGLTVEVAHQIVGLLAGRRRRSVGHVTEHLKALGLVETALRHYRHVLFVPTALQEPLRVAVHARLRPTVPPPPDLPPAPAGAATLVEDMARLLALITRGELLLTQQGQLQKRTLRSVIAHLGLAEQDAEATDRYPEPLGLLLAHGLEQGLAVRAGGVVKPGPQMASWLDLPYQVQIQGLLDFWQQRHQAADIEAALRLLRLAPGQWWRLDDLADRLGPLVNPVNRSSLRMRLEHHFQAFLQPLGQVALQNRDSGVWVMAPAAPAADDLPPPALFVQSDYEIIAGRPLPARLLWQLELAADLVHLDRHVQHYRLTSASFYRALGLGLVAEDTIATLDRVASRGLPRNVAFDLREWARHYGQISFAEVCIIRCATPELADQISAARKVRPLLVERLGPTALVIPRHRYEEVLDALTQEGYLPRPGIQREEQGGDG
jgi:hypothetical protein